MTKKIEKKSLIGIIIFATLLLVTGGLVTFFIVRSNKNPYDKYVSRAITESSMYSQKTSKYYVYLYSDSCSVCNSIKDEVLSEVQKGIDSLKEDQIYLLNSKALSDSSFYSESPTFNPDIKLTEYQAYFESSFFGSTSVPNYWFFGSPTLLGFEEGVLMSLSISSPEIFKTLGISAS